MILVRIIRFYQYIISPLLPPRCRYYPTCSQYAIEALQIHGLYKGTLLATKRLMRCHPWGGCGIDWVPPKPLNYYALYPVERSDRLLESSQYGHLSHRSRSVFLG